MCDPSLYCTTERERAVLAAVNRARLAAGVPPLASSRTLGASATHQARDMAAHNVLRHGLADGTTFGANISAHGYPTTYRAEVVHAGFADPESTVKAFLGSPGHRGILLSVRYKVCGVGYCYRAESTYDHHWCLHFGGRADAPAPECEGD